MLRTRLYLGLLPLLLLFVAVGLFAIQICRNLARAVDEDLTAHYAQLIGGYQMRDAAERATDALYTAQGGDLLEARDRFNEERSRFRRYLMEQSMAAAGTPRAELITTIDDAFDELTTLGNTIIERGVAQPLEALQQAERSLFATMRSLEQLNQNDYDELRRTATSAARLARLAIDLLTGALVFAILLSLFLSYRLARALLRPIEELTASATALGEGNLDTTVAVRSRDELGRLAEVFNDMAAKLRAYRSAMREEVRRAQRTTQATLSASPDPVAVFAADGRVELRNPAGEELALGPDTLPAPLIEAVERVIETGQHDLPMSYDRAIVWPTARGDRHYLPRILAIADPITALNGAALVLQDVTKFRLLDDAKNNLVGTVSHELKTPLTSLRMAVYLLLEQEGYTPRQRDMLELAREEADRLLRILNDLLDLARLESGAAPLHRTPVPARALLEAMAQELRPQIEAAGQRLVIEAAEDLPAVQVDRDRVRHVFTNLLTNAAKYAPAGTVVTLHAEPAGPDFVRCGVRDQGSGIAPEDVPHLFERFYRRPGETVTGAGLGLSIAREIVVAHGGSIACTSEPGRGSDFHFVLPVAGEGGEAA